MLKFAVKEDYENAKTELSCIPITLEYVQTNNQKTLPKVMNGKVKKK